MSDKNMIDFYAKILDLSYSPELSKEAKLKEVSFDEFKVNTKNANGLIDINGVKIAYSKWVSPKRTRSEPFARIYDTYHENKKVTIIPIVKDEGKNGDLDRINFMTLAWLNLMNVYIILAWYDEADKKPGIKQKITNQKFNEEYIKQKIQEINAYKLDAHHWNNKHFEDEFPAVLKRAVEAYQHIANKTGVELHNRENDINFLKGIVCDDDNNKLDLQRFKNSTLKGSKDAARREIQTTHALESLSDKSVKGFFRIENILGGEYYLTCDEIIQVNEDEVIIQESKNSSKGKLPSLGEIKDGIFKLILYSNIKVLKLKEKQLKFSTRLKLTGAQLRGQLILPTTEAGIKEFVQLNAFKKKQIDLINHLNKEAQSNKMLIVIEGDKESV